MKRLVGDKLRKFSKPVEVPPGVLRLWKWRKMVFLRIVSAALTAFSDFVQRDTGAR